VTLALYVIVNCVVVSYWVPQFKHGLPIPHIDFGMDNNYTTTEEAALLRHRTTDFDQSHVCRTGGSVLTILCMMTLKMV